MKIKEHHAVGTIPKSNIKIVERDKIDTPNISSIGARTKSHLRWSCAVELPVVALTGSDRVRMTDRATGSHDVT